MYGGNERTGGTDVHVKFWMYGCDGVDVRVMSSSSVRAGHQVPFMDLIQDYSSSSEPESNSDNEVDVQQEELGSLPNIIDYNLYLENYSNQHNMAACFIYIPWRPSHNTLINLKKACTQSMNQIKSRYPAIYHKYEWNIYGVPNYSVENRGKLALTHLQSVRDHHITLFPNLKGDDYKINQLIENVEHQISNNFVVDPKLISTKSEKTKSLDNFHKVLFKNQVPDSIKKNETYKKAIQLKLKNNLALLKNASGSSMFITAAFDLKIPQQFRFFASLQQILTENSNLLNLEVDGKGDESTESFVESNYRIFHVTLILAELKNINKKIDNQEYAKLRKLVGSPNFIGKVSEVIEVSVDALVIDRVALNREHHEVKFRL